MAAAAARRLRPREAGSHAGRPVVARADSPGVRTRSPAGGAVPSGVRPAAWASALISSSTRTARSAAGGWTTRARPKAMSSVSSGSIGWIDGVCSDIGKLPS